MMIYSQFGIPSKIAVLFQDFLCKCVEHIFFYLYLNVTAYGSWVQK